MKKTSILTILALFCIISGCSGSITPLELSDIQGPAQISERTTTQYSVDASIDIQVVPCSVGSLKVQY